MIVVTVRALKLHSGRHKVVAGKPLPPELLEENSADVEAGLSNLAHHLGIVRKSGVPAVVAINAFPDDHESEHQVIKDFAASKGVACVVSTHVADGGEGAQELAKAVVEAADQATDLHFSYEPEDALEDKINSIATKVYGADGIKIEPAAAKQLARFTELGFGKLPVLIAKTHLSTTADPADRGAPTGWTLPIREVRLAAGAGYVYALAGAMQTMPGLGTHPAAEKMDITPDGRIVGLF